MTMIDDNMNGSKNDEMNSSANRSTNGSIKDSINESVKVDINKTDDAGWNLDNSYVKLPGLFYARLSPTPVRSPKLAVLNHPLARSLGLDPEALLTEEGTAVLAGNRVPPGSRPLAQAYAGHQFGYFTMLGDGRAILLGEQITPEGERYDVQLKGSGRTPYSRGGDGRAVLGPMLREYIISEAMHALGIPTTRSLAVVTTGEDVFREGPQPGAVLTRIAASHIRVGTFQYAAAWGTVDDLRALADYTIERHFSGERHPHDMRRSAGEGHFSRTLHFYGDKNIPGIRYGSDDPLDLVDYEEAAYEQARSYPDNCEDFENKYVYLLSEVVRRQAYLVAKWQLVGFVHGVMNTDNMALSGETIDYGPCAFMDVYDPNTVFSSIDTHGRYAYGNQPLLAAWNLSRFAEALLPLLNEDEEKAVELAQNEITRFNDLFYKYWFDGMRAKLGIFNDEAHDDDIVGGLLGMMQKYKADFTNTFRALTYDIAVDMDMFKTEEFTGWKEQWKARLSRQPQSPDEARLMMIHNNPVVIPRNHRVEEALDAAVKHGDYSVMQKLLSVLSEPYSYSPGHELYTSLPAPSACPYRTFCGT